MKFFKIFFIVVVFCVIISLARVESPYKPPNKPTTTKKPTTENPGDKHCIVNWGSNKEKSNK